MTPLRFEVREWLGRADDPDQATLAELGIVAGSDATVLTRVSDSLALTLRDTVRVPALQLAEWLAVHWWRLRWESRPSTPNAEWLGVHRLAAISGGFAWPPLEIASDGEFIQLVQRPESRSDVAAIQYIAGATTIEVSAADFEGAVDRLFAQVQERLSLASPSYRDFAEVRAELEQERADPIAAQLCRWQARAGIDAGDAPEEWLAAIRDLADDAGAQALEEVLAVLGPGATAAEVDAVVGAFRKSGGTMDVSQLPRIDVRADAPGAPPWVRGVAAARQMRSALGIPTGPVSDRQLESFLDTNLRSVPSKSVAGRLSGAYRPDPAKGTALVFARSRRPSSLRFALARVVAIAAGRPSNDRLLPLSDATTATQKFSRAFAQEFLLPWSELDAATSEDGTDPESIEALAENYGVSDMLVATTLVNRGKLDRSELIRFQ